MKNEHPYYFELLKAMVIHRQKGFWHPGERLAKPDLHAIIHDEHNGVNVNPDTLRKILHGAYKSRVGHDIKNDFCRFVSDYGEYKDYRDFCVKEYWEGASSLSSSLSDRSKKRLHDRIKDRLLAIEQEKRKKEPGIFITPEGPAIDLEKTLQNAVDDIRFVQSQYQKESESQMSLIGVLLELLQTLDHPKFSRLLRDGEYQSIIEKLKQMKTAQPSFADHLMQKLQQFKGRNAYFFTGITHKENDSFPIQLDRNYWLGLLFFGTRQYGQAVNHFSSVERKDTVSFIKAQLRLSEIYLQLKKPDQAQLFLNQVEAFNHLQLTFLTPQEKVEHQIIQGEVYFHQQSYKKSFDCLNRQLKYTKWIAIGHYGKFLQARLFFNLSRVLPHLHLTTEEEQTFQDWFAYLRD